MFIFLEVSGSNSWHQWLIDDQPYGKGKFEENLFNGSTWFLKSIKIVKIVWSGINLAVERLIPDIPVLIDNASILLYKALL